MITQSQEKKMLIQSMKKLTGHVAGNHQRQKDIFQALSLQDFNKITSNLKDQNQYLRRISALFLCELFFSNRDTKGGVIRLLGVSPGWGRICLGGIPETICKYPSTLKKCVQLMHGELQEEQQTKMCWIINLQRKTLKLQFMDYKKYSSFTFIDPTKNIFGFTIFKKSSRKSPQKKSSQSKKSSNARIFQKDFKRSVQHYRNTVQQKQRSRDKVVTGKAHLNMTTDIYHNQRRNSTSSTSSNPYKNQLASSHRKSELYKTSDLRHTITGDHFKSKYQHSKITKPQMQFSPKVSAYQGRQALLNGRHNQSMNYEVSTDRGIVKHFNGVGPTTTRESTSTSRDQQRFYRRVKDIIHK